MSLSELEEADSTLRSDVSRLIHGDHWDPHQLLGLQDKVIRLYRPGASELFLEVKGEIHGANRVHPTGLFEFPLPEEITYRDYRIYHQNGLLAHDPYAFSPTWGEIDAHLLGKGVHYELYKALGAHLTTHQGVEGVKFAVWAPNAMRISVVGDFNFWDGRVNPMRTMGQSGVWELFIPGLASKERYKFEIKTKQGEVLLKSDPFATRSEHRPLNASVVSVLGHEWEDDEWMAKRRLEADLSKPFNIYEMHLGSWKLSHGHHLTYKQLAEELVAYCHEMGFTHVELLPVQEHPLDESWGYQVSGFFSVTSRYGSPEEFQALVDHLHKNNIGVILDWVPAHFPSDSFALARFDGTCLFEHEDPRQGYHPHWNTLIFNYGRPEVVNFLIASALFWCEQMHIDGLRVDAVASMLYLDYGREHGAWIPNAEGGKENLEAIEFLKHLNSILHQRCPGVVTIAEESTSFSQVTQNVEWGGLGFDYKWNMGWMNDTLRYFTKDPLYRRYDHGDLTFGLLYAFTEKFVLVLSHDEVVHGKGSLLSKMPGDYWQKFANLRLLLSYMICQPGKKMLFMGGELGQFSEWNVKEELHWHLLQYPSHQGIKDLTRDLNHFYLNHSQLWEHDSDFSGFEWVDFSDSDHSIISYRRKGSGPEQLLCVHNFTPVCHERYSLPLRGFSEAEELFNTDESEYGGSGKSAGPLEISPESLILTLPPLSTLIIQIN